MAQGVAWSARELGVPAASWCPITRRPPSWPPSSAWRGNREGALRRWWQVIASTAAPGIDGLFIHPVADRAVMAGNGTDRPRDPRRPPGRRHRARPLRRRRALLRHRRALAALRPEARVFGCEVETAAPLTASLAAGSAQWSTTNRASSTASAASGVLPEMWPLVSGCCRSARGAARRAKARHATARRARARRRRGRRRRAGRRRPRGRVPAAKSCAWSRAGTSTLRRSFELLQSADRVWGAQSPMRRDRRVRGLLAPIRFLAGCQRGRRDGKRPTWGRRRTQIEAGANNADIH